MSFVLTFYARMYELSSYSHTIADVQVYGAMPAYATGLMG